MTEWGVFLIIVALIGFCVTVTTPIIKLNTIITKLVSTVDTLTKTVEKVSRDLDDLTNRNAGTHERIFKQLEDLKFVLQEYDKRILILEKEIEHE